eukprot:gnl/MRDRNA2_/MRDRNA2_86041_c0_seq1.p1 gnl/MRDRNA2_/MRDRNA2_86041_c0~~gnl/MRDRNA2_/MRDRNA2_86041_c0_seq1.p1  ORF type:complete len:930 (-),score=152.34 gnl/MRDRNA2_/MRDRNA2_86041_c0_seq1:94-2544(-)
MAISIDYHPDWLGWKIINLSFLFFFTLEILVKVRSAFTAGHFLQSPMSILDLVVTSMMACEVVASLLPSGSIPSSARIILGIFTLARLVRLVKVIAYFRDLVVLLQSLLASLRSVLWSLSLLGLLLLFWAVIIRQSILFEWHDDEDMFNAAFPSVLESMVIIGRCWVFRAEGACHTENSVPLYNLFNSDAAWFFRVMWLASEFLIYMIILNAVTATFVVNGIKSEKIAEERIARHPDTRMKNTRLLKKLDKLLRSLIHPQRRLISPKDRNVAQVASYIRRNYPDRAALMTDMSKTLVDFAESIQEATTSHELAMVHYEAAEGEQCADLVSMPSATTYLVDGEEKLMVSHTDTSGEVCPACSKIGLDVAPAGAIEIEVVQESCSLDLLLEEAAEVQNHMKTFISDKKQSMSRGNTIESLKSARSLSSGSVPSIADVMNFQRTIDETKHNHALIVCDELVDPGPKQTQRIHEKVISKYSGRYERNRDYCRLSLVFETIERLLMSLKKFTAFSLNGQAGMQVMSIENRFWEPSALGWRDITVLLKVKVPTSGRHHVIELQLNLRNLADIRDYTHRFYKKVRAVLPEEAVSVIIDQLTSNTILDLDITRKEWLECLKNHEVISIMDQLQVPEIVRRNIIDILDADGSGSVSTAEMREILILCSANIGFPGDVVDCKLKVREMQQWLKNKVEPQLQILQTTLIQQANLLTSKLEQSFLEKRKNVTEAEFQGVGSPEVAANASSSQESCSVNAQVQLPSPTLTVNRMGALKEMEERSNALEQQMQQLKHVLDMYHNIPRLSAPSWASRFNSALSIQADFPQK